MTYTWRIKENATYIRKGISKTKMPITKFSCSNELVKRNNWIK